jgi:hypothetical protein
LDHGSNISGFTCRTYSHVFHSEVFLEYAWSHFWPVHQLEESAGPSTKLLKHRWQRWTCIKKIRSWADGTRQYFECTEVLYHLENIDWNQTHTYHHYPVYQDVPLLISCKSLQAPALICLLCLVSFWLSVKYDLEITIL